MKYTLKDFTFNYVLKFSQYLTIPDEKSKLIYISFDTKQFLKLFKFYRNQLFFSPDKLYSQSEIALFLKHSTISIN